MASTIFIAPRHTRDGEDGAPPRPVRTSRDGTEISAYDVIRRVFGWNMNAHHKEVRAMAQRVRETGFDLSARPLPGGGKPTATFAAARLDAFLRALDVASLGADNIVAGAAAAHRRAPVATRLSKGVAAAAATTARVRSSRQRKGNISRRAPLCPNRRGASIYSTVGYCGAVLMATLDAAAKTASISDGRTTASVGGDHPQDEGDSNGLVIDDDDDDDDNQIERHVKKTQHTGPPVRYTGASIAYQGVAAGDDGDDDTVLPFVRARAMPLATPGKPLRVWCTEGRAAARLCAVWPMGDGAHWGVSVPRRDSETVDHLGTIERADAVRMLARLVVVPGVVFVASRKWSSTRGPVVGPDVRGARALCDLALGPTASPRQIDS
ncbi:hypothetical protein psal_cds_669 [Pandoravirus salinus]|uniref:Uncharacterized protein n=1 Tax=Pandoravirus salinus TaxID=1349410 RepID=S4VW67_9VIRU|nr:hypothetical protein psal_cds_669 [Pandoravirus salinus]AGO84593.1 hypothetical protein psal_cds_669 [Pandoravirus salinus]